MGSSYRSRACCAGHRPGFLDADVSPTACVAEVSLTACALFVLIVCLIVPFTALWPFRYPHPSALDKMVASRADTTEHLPLNPVVDAFAYLPLER